VVKGGYGKSKTSNCDGNCFSTTPSFNLAPTKTKDSDMLFEAVSTHRPYGIIVANLGNLKVPQTVQSMSIEIPETIAATYAIPPTIPETDKNLENWITGKVKLVNYDLLLASLRVNLGYSPQEFAAVTNAISDPTKRGVKFTESALDVAIKSINYALLGAQTPAPASIEIMPDIPDVEAQYPSALLDNKLPFSFKSNLYTPPQNVSLIGIFYVQTTLPYQIATWDLSPSAIIDLYE
jgi:hypothetical protein